MLEKPLATWIRSQLLKVHRNALGPKYIAWIAIAHYVVELHYLLETFLLVLFFSQLKRKKNVVSPEQVQTTREWLLTGAREKFLHRDLHMEQIRNRRTESWTKIRQSWRNAEKTWIRKVLNFCLQESRFSAEDFLDKSTKINTSQAKQANHNRKAMSDKKHSKGMF